MKTKICPHCGKEIQDEAILCKYCHNLLIDDEGAGNNRSTNEDTIIFNNANIRNTSGQQQTEQPAYVDDYNDDYSDNYQEDDYRDDYNDNYNDNNQNYADDGYDDYADDGEEYDNADKKKVYTIVAVITIGIVVIALVSVLVAHKLFGGNDVKVVSTSTTTSTAAPADDSVAESTDDNNSDDAATTTTPAPNDDNGSTTTTPQGGETTTTTSAVSGVTTTTTTVSGSNTTTTTTAAPVDDKAVEEAVGNQVFAAKGSEVSSLTFREKDATYYYYYAYTADGQAYSVAYNTLTGEMIIK